MAIVFDDESPKKDTKGKKIVFDDEKSLFKRFGGALPMAGATAGGILGGGAGALFGMGVGAFPGGLGGAALGGAAGEAGRQLLGRALGEKVPETSGQAAKEIGVQGGLSAAGELGGQALGPIGKVLKKPATKLGQVAGKSIEAATGLRLNDVNQMARQGIKTYLTPGLEKAQAMFGDTLKSMGIPVRQTAEQLFDPQLSVAKRLGRQAAKKVDSGEMLTAEEALRARQAADRVIESTPLKDRSTRGGLMELRGKFDDALSSQSGELKKASDIYRKAVVKSKALTPTRLTKQGQQSAVVPLLASGVLSGTLGTTHDPVKSVASGAATVGATSPLVYGAGITGASDIARMVASPIGRRLLIQSLLRSKRRPEDAP